MNKYRYTCKLCKKKTGFIGKRLFVQHLLDEHFHDVCEVDISWTADKRGRKFGVWTK